MALSFGMLSSNARPIAIEFGVGSLKALQISDGEPPSLVAAACLETPEELRTDHVKRFEFQAQALPKVLKGAGFRGKRAICSIPASHTLVQHMQVQKAESGSLESLVAAQLQAQMNCDPSRVVIRPMEVVDVNRGGAARTEVICIAVARDLVLRQVQALKACKLDIIGAHCEHIALVRAFDHLTRRDGDATLVTLYLDLGAGTTKVAIAHGRRLVFAKTIHTGGMSLDQTVAQQMRMTAVEARAKRLTLAQLCPASPDAQAETAESGLSGGLAMLAAGERKAEAEAGAGAGDSAAGAAPGGEASTAVASDRRTERPLPGSVAPRAELGKARGRLPDDEPDLTEPLEAMTDEVAMCLRYHGALFPGKKIERAIFVGGEARHLALCQHVARTLRLPARVADPLAHVARTGDEPRRGIDFATAQPGWAVAYGLGECTSDL